MGKKKKNTLEGLQTVDETLASMGLQVVVDDTPSWVGNDEPRILPPNLIEQLVEAHRLRDLAAAEHARWESRRDGLFTGYLMAQGLPIASTYDLATGTVTVPKAQ